MRPAGAEVARELVEKCFVISLFAPRDAILADAAVGRGDDKVGRFAVGAGADFEAKGLGRGHPPQNRQRGGVGKPQANSSVCNRDGLSYGPPMRRLLDRLLVLAAVATFSGCALPVARQAAASHANPVLDMDFPDPATLSAADGFTYLYATQGSNAAGEMHNIRVARSRGLTDWEMLSDALPVKPGWASKTQDFWAPHVHAAEGHYFLYYSASPTLR